MAGWQNNTVISLTTVSHFTFSFFPDSLQRNITCFIKDLTSFSQKKKEKKLNPGKL